MKWKSVDKKAKELILKKIIGKTIEEFEFEVIDDSAKSLIITFTDGTKIRLYTEYSSINLSLPDVRYELTGKVKIGNLTTTLEPEMFDNQMDAQTKLNELEDQFNADFTGQILEVLK